MTDPFRATAGAVARLIRAPALHFFALGGLLFLANGWWQQRAGDEVIAAAAEAIVITSAQIDQMRQDFATQNGFPPDAAQLQAAIDKSVDEEVLFRQALATGLDRDNSAVRQRLIQDARFVADDPNQDDEALFQAALRLGLDRSDQVVRRQLAMMMRLIAADTPLPGETPPNDDELQAYLQAHANSFMEPERVSLTQVYVNDDRRGAAARARKLYARLREQDIGPDAAVGLGDPFLPGNRLSRKSPQDLTNIFGGDFVDALGRLAPGAWSRPIRSGYGWHLVWIDTVTPPVLPPLALVRERVLHAVMGERREQRVRQTLKSMRAGYSIRIETPAAGTAAGERAGANG